jgi:hypothetical protein
LLPAATPSIEPPSVRIAHHCTGARSPIGELFMKNITLWWASVVGSTNSVGCKRVDVN